MLGRDRGGARPAGAAGKDEVGETAARPAGTGATTGFFAHAATDQRERQRDTRAQRRSAFAARCSRRSLRPMHWRDLLWKRSSNAAGSSASTVMLSSDATCRQDRARRDRAPRSAERSPSSCGLNSNVTVTVSSARRVSIAAIDVVATFAGQRRDAQRVGMEAASRARSPSLELIALVEDLDRAARASAPTSVEHGVDGGHPAIAIGRGRVDHVQQQVGLGHFLERRAEGGDQRVRQPIDEADRVGDQQLAAIRQLDAADERIERHEERVRRDGIAAGQRD